MIILYYLYVLVPLCILGLVYILIGRTLRLRPQRSRKDKSHRHTVKMLGVIFLAFVLCWLPYIVGLTMTYVSLGTVNHQILVSYLQDLGVSGSARSLLSSYLNDRPYRTELGKDSPTHDLTVNFDNSVLAPRVKDDAASISSQIGGGDIVA
ncbi:unnamed protein product [Pleuronectes platessa]|uniref:G-protein coupled receptors family 1 profile domain-containing protein n=1 Tax=Pleuronectes platessa TaxID=8262 RepID=A0A9N7UET1_PLEPL|nr:unnamed protein product [Pleuronectes platessa]